MTRIAALIPHFLTRKLAIPSIHFLTRRHSDARLPAYALPLGIALVGKPLLMLFPYKITAM